MIKIDLEKSDTPIASDYGDVTSFVFLDPDSNGHTENAYCVGVKFLGLGGDESDPKNWEYDHCNYWDTDNDPEYRQDPRTVTRSELESVLAKHNTSIDEMCEQYVNTLFPKEHHELKSEIQHRTTPNMRKK